MCGLLGQAKVWRPQQIEAGMREEEMPFYAVCPTNETRGYAKEHLEEKEEGEEEETHGEDGR